MRTAFLGLMFCLFLHPVHVSVTGIDYDPGKNVFSIFVRVYSDDMERDMMIGDWKSGKPFKADNNGFGQWLSDRLKILVDDDILDMELKKVETDGFEHKFSLEAKGKRKAKNISVLNRIHTRLYQDQTNMLMFKYKNVEEGCKFTTTDTLKVFNIQ